MKVFISHSKDEEWLAEMIAAELEDIGVYAFHYERNDTGTIIDDKIRAELKDCDEFLVLLTPSSIWSHWVLYELSIAHYLGKRIVPFYMYIREHEIPAAARHVSYRPMGQIGTYYDELRRRTAPDFVGENLSALHPKTQRASEFMTNAMQLATENPQELFEVVRRMLTAPVTTGSAPAAPEPSPEPAPPEPSKPRPHRRSGKKKGPGRKSR